MFLSRKHKKKRRLPLFKNKTQNLCWLFRIHLDRNTKISIFRLGLLINKTLMKTIHFWPIDKCSTQCSICSKHDQQLKCTRFRLLFSTIIENARQSISTIKYWQCFFCRTNMKLFSLRLCLADSDISDRCSFLTQEMSNRNVEPIIDEKDGQSVTLVKIDLVFRRKKFKFWCSVEFDHQQCF